MNNLLSQGGALDHLRRYLPSRRDQVCRVSTNSPSTPLRPLAGKQRTVAGVGRSGIGWDRWSS